MGFEEDRKRHYFPGCAHVKWVGWLVGLLSFLLTDMDEVAGSLALAGDVRLEISVDAVLHFSVESLVQQTFEALQAVRVVGQAEFTKKDKWSTQTHCYFWRRPIQARLTVWYVWVQIKALQGLHGETTTTHTGLQILSKGYHCMQRLPQHYHYQILILMICMFMMGWKHLFDVQNMTLKRTFVCENTVSFSNVKWSQFEMTCGSDKTAATVSWMLLMIWKGHCSFVPHVVLQL